MKLKTPISEKVENIKDESKKQKKEIFATQSSVLNNLSELVEKKKRCIYPV